jgi:chromate transporter
LLLPDLPAGSPVLPCLPPGEAAAATSPVSITTTLTTVVTWLVIWFAPVAAVALLIYPDHLLVDIGLFFSKLAVVTFGGAYAVLAYMGQQAVETHNWLTADQMIDGFGLAETTPGPLILVTEFVGYMAGFRSAGLLGSVSMGLAAAAMALWVTFAPCFLWIFAGAPYVERLASMPRLSAALGAITAAVVGVIANLALWFGLHVLFEQVSAHRNRSTVHDLASTGTPSARQRVGLFRLVMHSCCWCCIRALPGHLACAQALALLWGWAGLL